MPFKFRALELLVNPNTVFLLLHARSGSCSAIELFNPGAILPGTLGAVSLIMALFGLAQLPINVAGLLLILLAFGLFVAEAFIVSHGALARQWRDRAGRSAGCCCSTPTTTRTRSRSRS